jgi:uncharacterized protein YjiK
MAWDPTREKMLLACKGEMPRMAKGKKSFAIYAMDLQSRKVLRQPVIIITKQMIEDYVGTHPNRENLKASMSDDFAPSAIAVHPLTRQLYVLSARGNMLLVLDSSGDLQHLQALDPITNPQPEGIAFGADGTMYISNESRGSNALLHKFSANGDVD